MASATRQGPALTITGTCEGCAFLDPEESWSRGKRAMLCVEPSLLGRGPRYIGGLRSATPAWCPLLPAARLALLVLLASTICRKCGRTVEPERECYAIPTCFACLPPPPPMAAHPGFAAWQKRQEEEAESAAHGAGESEEQKR
jgi:hypothetical protein